MKGHRVRGPGAVGTIEYLGREAACTWSAGSSGQTTRCPCFVSATEGRGFAGFPPPCTPTSAPGGLGFLKPDPGVCGRVGVPKTRAHVALIPRAFSLHPRLNPLCSRPVAGLGSRAVVPGPRGRQPAPAWPYLSALLGRVTLRIPLEDTRPACLSGVAAPYKPPGRAEANLRARPSQRGAGRASAVPPRPPGAGQPAARRLAFPGAQCPSSLSGSAVMSARRCPGQHRSLEPASSLQGPRSAGSGPGAGLERGPGGGAGGLAGHLGP